MFVLLGIPYSNLLDSPFMNAKLTHDIYVKLPKGISIMGKTFGRALKSIYGLRQAAHDWHQLQEMELFYVPTAKNVADIFTKGLSTDVFQGLMIRLMGTAVESD